MARQFPTLPPSHQSALKTYLSSDPQGNAVIRTLLVYLGERPLWSFDIVDTNQSGVSENVLVLCDDLNLVYTTSPASGEHDHQRIHVAHNEQTLTLYEQHSDNIEYDFDIRAGVCYEYPAVAVAEFTYGDSTRQEDAPDIQTFAEAYEADLITKDDYAHLEVYYGGFVPGDSPHAVKTSVRRARYYDDVLRTFAAEHGLDTVSTVLDRQLDQFREKL